MDIVSIILQAGTLIGMVWCLLLPFFIYRTFKVMCRDYLEKKYGGRND